MTYQSGFGHTGTLVYSIPLSCRVLVAHYKGVSRAVGTHLPVYAAWLAVDLRASVYIALPMVLNNLQEELALIPIFRKGEFACLHQRHTALGEVIYYVEFPDYTGRGLVAAVLLPADWILVDEPCLQVESLSSSFCKAMAWTVSRLTRRVRSGWKTKSGRGSDRSWTAARSTPECHRR